MTSKLSEQDQEIINLIKKYTSKTKEDEEKNPLQKNFSEQDEDILGAQITLDEILEDKDTFHEYMLINDDKKEQIEAILKEINFKIKVLKEYRIRIRKEEREFFKKEKDDSTDNAKKKANEIRITSVVDKKIKALKDLKKDDEKLEREKFREEEEKKISLEEKADEIEKEREETQEQNNIIKRIKDTDKIFEMLFNHELLVNKNLIYGKLNNLYIKKPFMFILNVKYYQWKHPELKNNEMFNKIENIRELVQDASKDDVLDDYTRKHQRKTENLQVEEIDFHFSLPMKEEAKRILLVIGNRILHKYPSVDIKGSIEIDEINGLCSMLFYNNPPKNINKTKNRNNNPPKNINKTKKKNNRNNNPEIISNLNELGNKFNEINSKFLANKKITNKRNLIDKISGELNKLNNSKNNSKNNEKKILNNISRHLKENISNLESKGKLSKVSKKLKKKTYLKKKLSKLNNNNSKNNTLKKLLISNLDNNIKRLKQVKSGKNKSKFGAGAGFN